MGTQRITDWCRTGRAHTCLASHCSGSRRTFLAVSSALRLVFPGPPTPQTSIHWIILFGDTWKTQSIEVPPWQLKNLNCQSIKTLQRSMMTRNSVKGCLKISKNESQHAPKEMVAIWSIFCKKKKVKSINECEKKLFFFFKTALLSYLCCCSLGDFHEMGTCFCSWLKFNFQKFALLCYQMKYGYLFISAVVF